MTSSGRTSRDHAEHVGPHPRFHVPAHVDDGGIDHQGPDAPVGGRAAGGEIGAEALAGQRQLPGVHVGTGAQMVEDRPQGRLVVGAKGHGRVGAHATGLTGPVEDEDVPASFGPGRPQVEVQLLGAGVEPTHPDQSGTTPARSVCPRAGRQTRNSRGVCPPRRAPRSARPVVRTAMRRRRSRHGCVHPCAVSRH